MNPRIKTLLDLDARLSDRLRLALTPARRRLLSLLAHSGDSWFWLAGLGLVWLLDSPFWHLRSAVMGLGFVFLAVFVLGIKFTVRRRRPEGEWGAIYRATDPHSFPSGHAARSGLFAVLGLGLGPAWFGLLLAVWAPLLGLSRVVMGVHYLSDVVVGLAIGILVGLGVLAFLPQFLAMAPAWLF